MTKTELIKNIARILFEVGHSDDGKTWDKLPRNIKNCYILDANKVYDGLVELKLGIGEPLLYFDETVNGVTHHYDQLKFVRLDELKEK